MIPKSGTSRPCDAWHILAAVSCKCAVLGCKENRQQQSATCSGAGSTSVLLAASCWSSYRGCLASSADDACCGSTRTRSHICPWAGASPTPAASAAQHLHDPGRAVHRVVRHDSLTDAHPLLACRYGGLWKNHHKDMSGRNKVPQAAKPQGGGRSSSPAREGGGGGAAAGESGGSRQALRQML